MSLDYNLSRIIYQMTASQFNQTIVVLQNSVLERVIHMSTKQKVVIFRKINFYKKLQAFNFDRTASIKINFCFVSLESLFKDNK